MREFAFTVTFEPGADGLMDLFVEESSLRARSRACFANERAMWRIDELQGPPGVLARLDEVYLDEEVCNECLDDERCDSTRKYQVLDRDDEHRVFYTRREGIEDCHSMPSLAVEEVGDGVLMETTRQGREYVWRILAPGDATVGALYDRVAANLRPGLSLELREVCDATGEFYTESGRVLSVAERETLAAAAEAGYYDVPRGTTVAELADRLDVPRSTVQHRLQRSEAKVVDRFLERTDW